MPISFYPGPSKVYEQIPFFVQEAFQSGILSINHRSREFVDISKKAILLLKKKLNIPEDYVVLYASSATECWEIIAQSLIKNKSFHIYNGAFGEKWHEYTSKLKDTGSQNFIQSYSFGLEKEPQIHDLLNLFPEDNEWICITHNETSNGSALSNDFIHNLKKTFPDQLIAMDATSSLGGVELPLNALDICYASVQKCFGLPAGLALMICSPRAAKRALEINEKSHYNSLVFMLEKIQDYQTTYTPNVLDIYLLMRVMELVPEIGETTQKLKARASDYYELVSGLKNFDVLIQSPQLQSTTVITIKGEEEIINEIKNNAKKQNIILGNGYGYWKNTTFMIANFPAITNNEIVILRDFLQKK